MNNEKKTMRDVFIEQVCERMQKNKKIFFLTADFGSPKLDKLRKDFKDRFVNVGIAEQNLINVSAGLALEGMTVYSYAIAPFLIMRAYEQIRINLSLHAQVKEMNVNLIGVGAGLSYDVSGPTHHCLEDISIIRALPNMTLLSPSDWTLAQDLVDYSIENKTPKYLRFDGKPVSQIYDGKERPALARGMKELVVGDELCIVSTGFMTHTALRIADVLRDSGMNIGVIDVFMIKPFNDAEFVKLSQKYRYIMTLEEAFINKGGLDSLIAEVLGRKGASQQKLIRKGFGDSYVFEMGSRAHLHEMNGLGHASITKEITEIVNER